MSPTVEVEVERAVEELLQGQMVATVPQFRAEAVLRNLAHRVDQNARAGVLLSLLTAEDVARQFGVSSRRIRAKAKALNQRGFAPVGWQVPGTNAWLFTPEELDNLRPLPQGRPRKAGGQ